MSSTVAVRGMAALRLTAGYLLLLVLVAFCAAAIAMPALLVPLESPTKGFVADNMGYFAVYNGWVMVLWCPLSS